MTEDKPHAPAPDSIKPFRLVQYFSLTSLAVLIIFAVAMSGFLANRARNVVMDQYQEYAMLLAANLNHQVFRQFVLPTATLYGKIDLSSEFQYRRMDKVVRQTIHSLNIDEVNVYDVRGILVYSTEEKELGRHVQLGADFDAASSGRSVSRLASEASLWGYIRHRRLNQAVILRTLTPFRAEQIGITLGERPVLGVFELIMNLTDEMEQIFKHQVLAALVASGLLGLMMIILTLVVRQGEMILNRRAEERKRLEVKLQEAERMAALGRMVASVSHEIKSPLGIIRSTGELLASQMPQEDPSRQLTGVIIEECSRLNRIVTEFLDFARPQVPNMRSCQVGDLLARNLAALWPELEKHDISLRQDLDHPPEIMADPDLLYRAFLNVLLNAVQAMPRGGELRVSARPREDGRGCVVEVADNGPGIVPENLARMFEPFFTNKEKGSGLGLSIVKSIVEAHHGRIEVDSTPGQGTRVRIIL